MPDPRQGQPRTNKRKCGIQPAHQSLITDVFRSRPLLCTIHHLINFTLASVENVPVVRAVLDRGHQNDRTCCLLAVPRSAALRAAPAAAARKPASGFPESRGPLPCRRTHGRPSVVRGGAVSIAVSPSETGSNDRYHPPVMCGQGKAERGASGAWISDKRTAMSIT
jgi:hypothetical protein